MATKNIEADTGAIKSGHGSATKEYQEAMQSQLKEMLAAIEGLNSVWEGPNHDEFMKHFEDQKLNLDNFNKSIASFLKAWKNAYEAYDACENDVAQRVG